MAKHRVLFEFSATPGNAATAGSDAGWTTAWYDPADLTDDNAAVKAIQLLNGRLPSLTAGWRCSAIRISQLDAQNNLLRKGRLIQFGGNVKAGTYPAVGGSVDEQPWDAVNLAIATVGGSRRAFLMRGIGSNVVGASGQYLAPPAFIGAAALFAAALAGGGAGGGGFGRFPVILPGTPYALRTRTATAETQLTTVTTVKVDNVNLIPDPTKPLIRVPINTVQAGNQVSIKGVADMTGINGDWKATAVQLDPLNNQFNYVILAPRRRVTVNGIYKQGGVVRYWNWALDNVTGFTIGNGASRRTGRPPQQRRGRRSARRS